VAAAIFVVLMLVTPAIPQDEAYHHFADHRTLFLGIMRSAPAARPLPASRPLLSSALLIVPIVLLRALPVCCFVPSIPNCWDAM